MSDSVKRFVRRGGLQLKDPPDAAEQPTDACGHACAPVPALTGAFSWRNAAGPVPAAGARPCPGAILVLVFALAQGLFAAGIAATFAIALGAAVTTGALALTALFAKSAAMRLAAGENSRLALVARGFEFAAALGCWHSASHCWSARAVPRKGPVPAVASYCRDAWFAGAQSLRTAVHGLVEKLNEASKGSNLRLFALCPKAVVYPAVRSPALARYWARNR